MQHCRAGKLAVAWPLALLALTLAACGGGGSAPPHATLTPRPTATRTSTPTPTPTDTPTPIPTDTPVPEPTSTPEPREAPLGYAQVIRRADTSSMTVTFTFDAGSDAGYTSQILDTLGQNHIIAAFGITGVWAENNPDLLRRLVAEGHAVINHTYDHSSFTGASTSHRPLSQRQRWQEIDSAEATIQQIAGVSSIPYFRPPYGDYDDLVDADVFAHGYRYNIMWSVDSLGWYGYGVPKIIDTVMNEVQPGAIIIMHVGTSSQDGPALQRVIDGLKQRGYGFVPLTAIAPR